MYRTSIALIVALLAIPTIAAAAGSVQLPASGQTTCYDSAGNPRGCTGTGEDGEVRAGLPWPTPRFVAGEATVTDSLTGLVWTRHANAPDVNAIPPFVCTNAEGDMSWQQALDHVACLNTNNYAGFSDWRLPSLNELESMVNAGAPDPSGYLSANGFGPGDLGTLVQPSSYWSSTSDAFFNDSAWDVNFLTGDYPFSSVKIPVLAGLDTRAVWPVRGEPVGAVSLSETGQRLCFSAAGAEIDCAGSGQDGELRSGVAIPELRFRPGTQLPFTLDRLTGLVWTTGSRTPGVGSPPPAGCAVDGGLLDWQQALEHVACLNRSNYLGKNDWRLPNRNELRSLVDYSASAPALAGEHPFADLLTGDAFWSSTSDAASPDRAWTVNLVDGGVSASGKAGGALLPVWPVTGPDLAPPAVAITGGDLTINVSSRSISGTVEEGGEVTVALNGGTSAPAQVTGGTWSFTVTSLAAGANNVTATAGDFSENLSSAAIGITFIVPDGKLAGGDAVTIADALIALRFVVGLATPDDLQLLRGDVAPLGAPDGRITLTDTLLILRKSVALESF